MHQTTTRLKVFALFIVLCNSFYTISAQSPGGVSAHLKLWLRADTATSTTANNLPVSSWGDKSGNAFNATQSNYSNQPFYRNNATDNINYNPVLNFDGNDMINVPYNSALNGHLTSFFVYNPNSSNNTLYASGTGVSTTNGWGYSVNLSNRTLTGYRNGASQISTSGSNLGNTEIASMDMLLGVTQQARIYVNGKATVTGTLNYQSNTSGVYSIGSDGRGANFWNGRIAEHIFYDSLLSTIQRQKINTYLAIKYGIPLDQSSPQHYMATDGSIIWNANKNASYKNNLAGIGRDDAEVLMQKQSQCAGGQLQIIIGNSTLASSNSANSNAFSFDKSYEIWGDNGLSTDYTTSITNNAPGASINLSRMARTWKIAEYGTVGQVQVALPNQFAGNGTSTYLVVSSDSTFSSGCTWYTLSSLSLNGSSYLATVVNFTDGQFFTYASKGLYPGGVPGMAVWLKADDLSDLGTADSITVNTWRNFGSSGAYALQSNPALTPVFRKNSNSLVNFNPCLVFDGINDNMTIAYSNTYNKDLTAFSVHNQTAASGNRCVFSSRTNSNPFQGWALITIGNVRNFQTGATGSNLSITASPYLAPSTEMTGMDMKLGTNQTARLFINGKTATTGTISYVANTSTLRPFTCGANSDLTSYWNGAILEQIVYGTVLHDTMRNRINTYLAIKYGISLDQTTATHYVSTDGKKIWNANANSTYKNNIAGIGRDDAEGLLQKQSMNSSGGFQAVVSLSSSIASTNKDNTAGFSTDISYLTWGDNGQSSAFSTSITNNLPFGVSGVVRMARVWKFQKTGTVDSVTIALQDIYITGNFKYLVLSNDSNFNSGNLWLALGNVGGSYLGARISTAAGKYFTFVKSATNPGGVKGVKLWIKANDGDLLSKSDGSSVSAWNNQANSGSNLSQGTSASQPLYKSNTTDNINFNPVLMFDGTNDYLMSPYNSTYNDRFTAFSVHNQTAASASRSPFGSRNFSLLQGWQYFHNINTRTLTTGNGTTFFNITGSSYTPGVTEILGIYSFKGTNVNAGIFVNGFTTGSGTVSYASNIFNGYSAGSNSDPSAYWNGNIAEQILYDTTLSPTQNQRINTYLAVKYGVTLSQSSPYHYLATDGSIIWNANQNATYKNNIAGIGRDDAEGLLQKQSQSINPGRQVLMGIGSLSADNQSNTNQYTADKTYLIWGDNNGLMSFLTPISNNVPGGVSNPYRMARVWKVQTTGTLPTVKVAFQGSFSATGFKYLVVSIDSSFGSGCTWYPLSSATINGNTYYTCNVNFSAGQFFTYVSKGNIHPGGVSGSTLWLRADDDNNNVLATGTALSYWTNSGNGTDALQTVSASRPIYRSAFSSLINFYPTIQLGSPTYFNLNDNLGLSNQTQITAFAVGNGTTSYYLRPSTALTNAADFYSSAAGLSVIGLYNSTNAAGTMTVTGSKGFISSGNRSGNNFNSYTNGKLLNSAVSSTAFAANSSFNIGMSPTGSYNNAGMLMSELIVYPNTLTASQQQKLHSYLAIKYGVTLNQLTPTNYLATDGTVIWHSSFNQSFNNNIAGIGRDDAEGLMQRQAMSSNSGTQLLVGVGGSLNSNINNSNVFTVDKSYLTWGDNNGVFTFTEDVMSGLRLARVWKFQKTGTVANVMIALPATVVGTPTSNLYVIVHDNDSTFGSDYKRYPTSNFVLNNTGYTGAIVPISSGQFVTFGFLDCNLPALAAGNTRTTVTSNYCQVGDWLYYQDPADPSQCLVAINPNGNTWNPDSVILDVTYAGTYMKTDGINTTELAKRMLTIVAPGTYTVNGGIMVRMYYNSSEFTTLPSTTRQWFKHPGNKYNTLADITPQWLANCSILTPDSSGSANNIEFVEFRNITSFSTFGFGGTTNLVALPVKLIEFKAEAHKESSVIRWTINADNSDAGTMELLRSEDGRHWTTFKVLNFEAHAGLRTYEVIDPTPTRPQTFYKLAVYTDRSSNINSDIAVLNWKELKAQVSLTPNPSSGKCLLSVKGLDSPKQFEIINQYGTVLYSGKIQDETDIQLNLERYPDGVYWIRVFDQDSTWTGRLVMIKE